MTTETTPTLEESKERLLVALEIFQEMRDPCEDGHVPHDESDHLGRRLVHSMAGAMGADWDADAAIDFIRGADLVVRTTGFTKATGHGGAARNGGRFVAFATKP